MHYQCSECSRPMGVMLDMKGRPELFKCPYSGRGASTIPDRPVSRDTPPLPKWLETVDLSTRARRQERTVDQL